MNPTHRETIWTPVMPAERSTGRSRRFIPLALGVAVFAVALVLGDAHPWWPLHLAAGIVIGWLLRAAYAPRIAPPPARGRRRPRIVGLARPPLALKARRPRRAPRIVGPARATTLVIAGRLGSRRRRQPRRAPRILKHA